jgi:hypothetical protein
MTLTQFEASLVPSATPPLPRGIAGQCAGAAHHCRTLIDSPIDGYGAVTGSETPITPGPPMALAAAGRWRITYDGDGGSSAPLSSR